MLEASKYNSLRIVGPFPQGHDAKSVVAQKANVGSRPCCEKATHIAVPTSFKLGEYSPLKELGMHLWAEDGPWAGRRLAAVDYVMDNNGSPLPDGWYLGCEIA